MSEPIEDARHLSRRTTPTWEVELLISGVAVFAMLQLPGWLDDRMFALEPRLNEGWQVILLLFYLYAKSAAVVLAATFAMHLLLRAQWIALVGMSSVYPQGVRLDKMRMGTIQRAIEEAHPDNSADAIERADNRASVVFAIGVSIAMLITGICIGVSGTLLLATVLLQALGWQVNPLTLMAVIFFVVFGTLGIALGLDQAFAGRLRPEGRAHRMLEAVLRFYIRLGMGSRNNRIIAILTSNGGQRKMMAVVFGVMFAALIGVSLMYTALRTGRMIGNYALFPDSEAQRIDAAHYDDQRDPARDDAVPYVQGAVITGAYLKLVVPYKPRRDEAAMRECKLPAGTGDAQQRTDRLLACMQALRTVTLDGKPLADLRYEIASDPRTDRPALLAMIDVRNLPRGRHELRITRPVRKDRKFGKPRNDPGVDVIPFWR